MLEMTKNNTKIDWYNGAPITVVRYNNQDWYLTLEVSKAVGSFARLEDIRALEPYESLKIKRPLLGGGYNPDTVINFSGIMSVTSYAQGNEKASSFRKWLLHKEGYSTGEDDNYDAETGEYTGKKYGYTHTIKALSAKYSVPESDVKKVLKNHGIIIDYLNNAPKESFKNGWIYKEVNIGHDKRPYINKYLTQKTIDLLEQELGGKL